jgi:hypothetical protein
MRTVLLLEYMIIHISNQYIIRFYIPKPAEKGLSLYDPKPPEKGLSPL